MNIIGLTGISGAGKSTAADFFRQNGFFVIDCDTVARECIARSPCVDEVKRNFPEIFDNCEISSFNRAKARKHLFSAPEKLELYQKIVFPYVVYSIMRLMQKAAESGCNDILLDASTLFQSGADDFCGSIIAVVAEKNLCIQRITKRDQISAEEGWMRLNNQPSIEFFAENSDVIIQNNGSLEEFKAKLEKFFKRE
ncbi:MAG: dephospho-CoA kinase [Oscillospiraceae bacterium]|nr:dephospho-CoA kinase [Oscillospiraceae bacterium]